jgi:hypothetical protein
MQAAILPLALLAEIGYFIECHTDEFFQGMVH